MLRTISAALSVVTLVTVHPAAAAPARAPMPAGYDDPGPPPDNVLPKIVSKLRTTLSDPYSVRDFTICKTEKIQAYFGVQWVPAQWIAKITLNSKNGYGGYTGSTMFVVDFAHGEVSKISQFKGLDLVSTEVNERLLAMAQRCPRVPDSEIQHLLSD